VKQTASSFPFGNSAHSQADSFRSTIKRQLAERFDGLEYTETLGDGPGR